MYLRLPANTSILYQPPCLSSELSPTGFRPIPRGSSLMSIKPVGKRDVAVLCIEVKTQLGCLCPVVMEIDLALANIEVVYLPAQHRAISVELNRRFHSPLHTFAGANVIQNRGRESNLSSFHWRGCGM